MRQKEEVSMAVTKRTRFEVLRRDNHTCRYCGASAPDATLTVDHVTPVALGGTDDPGNLVAACRDCNAGKSSTSPDAAVVADVKALDLKWSGALKRVANARARQRKKRAAYAVSFYDYWTSWTYGNGKYTYALPVSWQASIERFYDLGVPMDELIDCARIAITSDRIRLDEEFRYFCGCVWRTVTEMQEAAKELLTADEATD
ncbi:MAG: HNH endonuclease [Nocardioidaceae bacterium]|nr:HNH endonuclease [Nocardioidaceae bacterium]